MQMTTLKQCLLGGAGILAILQSSSTAWAQSVDQDAVGALSRQIEQLEAKRLEQNQLLDAEIQLIREQLRALSAGADRQPQTLEEDDVAQVRVDSLVEGQLAAAAAADEVATAFFEQLPRVRRAANDARSSHERGSLHAGG